MDQAVKDGKTTQSEVERALRNLFRLRIRLGMLDPPASVPYYGVRYNDTELQFNQEHVASPSRMFHNVWYCVLGAIQLGLWEALFMHCYATGKLDYIKNEEAFATPENAFRMVFFTLAIPLYRSVHFYFAHRFIHIRALCECHCPSAPHLLLPSLASC